MEYFAILLPLGLILLLSKLLSMVCKRFGLPQVIGMLVAGLLLSFIRYIPGQTVFTDTEGGTLEGLSFIAKIGVILIMFSAGLETDLKQFKKMGLPCAVITILGVVVPCGLGFVVATLFNGGFQNITENIYDNLFYGVILSATSVSVTVATLKEMGKLNGKLGASIIAAAILDDIIGVILLSLIIGLKNTGGSGAGEVGILVLKMLIFFALAIVLGILIHKLFKWMSEKWPNKRRVSVFGLVVCFLYSFAAEKFFSVADITGAFMAGVVLAGLKNTEFIDSKVEMSNYIIFAPVFFANICLTINFSGLDLGFVGFGFAYVVAGLLGKVIGAGGGALMCKYGFKDSLRVGIGMMARAEVVLVCTQKGVDNGMVDPAIMPFVLIMIAVSALATPLLLKLSYKKEFVSLSHLPTQPTP